MGNIHIIDKCNTIHCIHGRVTVLTKSVEKDQYGFC